MTGIARLLKPLDEFLRVETLSGLALLTAAAVAIVFANSAWHAEFHRFWDVPRLAVGLSLHFLVNEILMAVFFLVVGLEIRREIHDGALSTPAQAALPLVAACGGIVAPALIYLAVAGEPLIQGWAVPTATDIAFTIGVLALLGRRVAPALRVLLLAIAIADDIAAVLIIAFFYADGIVPGGLALAAAGAVAARLGYRAGINSWAACLLSGALIWLGLLLAGVHPALAGVAAGLLAPMQPRVPGAQPAGEQLETALHPWVAFGVMPLFALANAGVRFEGLDLSDAMSGGLAGGVALGLFVGKPLGICVASAVAVRAGLCALPASVTPGAVLVAGCFAGIGFTMSIFIASLAFAEPGLLAVAKFGVLSGSVCAAVAGLLLGRMLLRAPPG